MLADMFTESNGGGVGWFRTAAGEVLKWWLPSGVLYVAIMWVTDPAMRSVRAVVIPLVLFTAIGVLRGTIGWWVSARQRG
jgi:hypothetical protein